MRFRRLVGMASAGLVGAGLVGAGILAGVAAPAGAHPLGNFTTNTSAALRIRPDEVLVDYVVDLAEIPTLQARPDIDADGDDDLSDGEQADYAATTCDGVAAGLTLEVDGTPVEITSADPSVSFPEGEAGLDTTRVECHLSAPAVGGNDATTVHFVDTNFTDKLGWREVMAQGDGTTVVETDVEAESTSDRLTSYPPGEADSPIRELEATVRVVPGGPAAPDPDADTAGGALPTVDRLTDLVGERRLTVPFAVFALALSFVLGGFHALAPGHGKTVMAAYLVGSEGTRRQALLLGLTVAVTHTGGVFALALVVSNSALAPERLYPVLGTISGLLVAAIGVALLRRAVRFRRLFPTLGPGASTHHHHGIGGHSHTHTLGGHTHDHDHGAHGNGHDHDHGDGESALAAAGAPTHQTATGHDHGDHTQTHAHDTATDHVHVDHTHTDHPHDGATGLVRADRNQRDGGHDHTHAVHTPAVHTHTHGAPTGDTDADHLHATATDHVHDHTHDHLTEDGSSTVPEAVDAVDPVDEVGPHPMDLEADPPPVDSPDGDHANDGPAIAPRMKLRNMMAMGFAGGLVPSPSALVVLLGSIAIGRAWFGLLLIIAYGAGLAAVLVGAGLVIERLRHRIEPLLARGRSPRVATLAVNLPIITSVLVVLGGAFLVVRAVAGA